MFKGPNWNKLMSTRQGSPEALGTDENRCLLNLGTQASQGNYTYIFWIGSGRKEVATGDLKFALTTSKFPENPDTASHSGTSTSPVGGFGIQDI